jgi:hypothetical protein
MDLPLCEDEGVWSNKKAADWQRLFGIGGAPDRVRQAFAKHVSRAAERHGACAVAGNPEGGSGEEFGAIKKPLIGSGFLV